jgi:hypothetical protein
MKNTKKAYALWQWIAHKPGSTASPPPDINSTTVPGQTPESLVSTLAKDNLEEKSYSRYCERGGPWLMKLLAAEGTRAHPA